MTDRERATPAVSADLLEAVVNAVENAPPYHLDHEQIIADILAAISAAGYVNLPRQASISVLASLTAAISLLERGGKKAAASDKMFYVMLEDYRSARDDFRAALATGAGHEA